MNSRNIIAGIIFFAGIVSIVTGFVHLEDHGDVRWAVAAVFVGLLMCIGGGLLDRSAKK